MSRHSRRLVLRQRCDGKQGTHQALLAERGIYYRLYQLQYQDQEVVPPTDLTPAERADSHP